MKRTFIWTPGGRNSPYRPQWCHVSHGCVKLPKNRKWQSFGHLQIDVTCQNKFSRQISNWHHYHCYMLPYAYKNTCVICFQSDSVIQNNLKCVWTSLLNYKNVRYIWQSHINLHSYIATQIKNGRHLQKFNVYIPNWVLTEYISLSCSMLGCPSLYSSKIWHNVIVQIK